MRADFGHSADRIINPIFVAVADADHSKVGNLDPIDDDMRAVSMDADRWGDFGAFARDLGHTTLRRFCCDSTRGVVEPIRQFDFC